MRVRCHPRNESSELQTTQLKLCNASAHRYTPSDVSLLDQQQCLVSLALVQAIDDVRVADLFDENWIRGCLLQSRTCRGKICGSAGAKLLHTGVV